VKAVKKNGISFGIWIEPEMINPDSDLFRAHPEWVLAIPGRVPALSREQLVLDMANPEVVDYLIDSFTKVFEGAPIDYFKWDANRHLCDVYSSALPDDRQDEVPFRFMKGVYRLFKWFGEHFPEAIIETCAGGGGRYDLGMMKYGFQIWTSDNTWPYARVWMQRSSLLAYPAATMSCHVSNPGDNMRSLDYRYKVAVGGMLGYELNILHMNDEIKAEMSKQVKEYKSFEHLMRLGDYYNLASPFLCDYSAYYYTNKEGTEILFSMIQKRDIKKGQTKALKIKQAKKDAVYVDLLSGSKYSGEELRRGLVLPLIEENDTAILLYLVEEQQ
jgi:alpha-galactosidase